MQPIDNSKKSWGQLWADSYNGSYDTISTASMIAGMGLGAYLGESTHLGRSLSRGGKFVVGLIGTAVPVFALTHYTLHGNSKEVHWLPSGVIAAIPALAGAEWAANQPATGMSGRTFAAISGGLAGKTLASIPITAAYATASATAQYGYHHWLPESGKSAVDSTVGAVEGAVASTGIPNMVAGTVRAIGADKAFAAISEATDPSKIMANFGDMASGAVANAKPTPISVRVA